MDSDLSLRELTEEKEQLVNNLYQLRMDITKKVEELEKRNSQVSHFQEEISSAHRKVEALLKKEQEIVQLQNEVESFIDFFV